MNRAANHALLKALVAVTWLWVLASRAANLSETNHWSFRPLEKPRLPPMARAEMASTAVDRFLLAELESNGLRFSEPASRERILRRLYFDLIGLPPSIADVKEFLADDDPAAVSKVIEKLLASPHYGERWGRHWLDLARYAESDGFEHDAIRPNAWRYRDYVIDAFNADLPYDVFIREQISGDELWPEDPRALTATGFHLLGPDMVDSEIGRAHV